MFGSLKNVHDKEVVPRRKTKDLDALVEGGRTVQIVSSGSGSYMSTS